MEIIIRQLLDGDPQRFDNFLWNKDNDFAFTSKSGTSYRVNAYFKTGEMAVVMRKIYSEARQIEDLVFNDIAQSIKKKCFGCKKMTLPSHMTYMIR